MGAALARHTPVSLEIFGDSFRRLENYITQAFADLRTVQLQRGRISVLFDHKL